VYKTASKVDLRLDNRQGIVLDAVKTSAGGGVIKLTDRAGVAGMWQRRAALYRRSSSIERRIGDWTCDSVKTSRYIG
jgi:hypothetical protein